MVALGGSVKKFDFFIAWRALLADRLVLAESTLLSLLLVPGHSPRHSQSHEQTDSRETSAARSTRSEDRGAATRAVSKRG